MMLCVCNSAPLFLLARTPGSKEREEKEVHLAVNPHSVSAATGNCTQHRTKIRKKAAAFAGVG